MAPWPADVAGLRRRSRAGIPRPESRPPHGPSRHVARGGCSPRRGRALRRRSRTSRTRTDLRSRSSLRRRGRAPGGGDPRCRRASCRCGPRPRGRRPSAGAPPRGARCMTGETNDGRRDLERAVAELAERLPGPLAPLARVTYNYRWSWLPDGPAIFADADPRLWGLSGGNPRWLIEAIPPRRLA